MKPIGAAALSLIAALAAPEWTLQPASRRAAARTSPPLHREFRLGLNDAQVENGGGGSGPAFNGTSSARQNVPFFCGRWRREDHHKFAPPLRRARPSGGLLDGETLFQLFAPSRRRQVQLPARGHHRPPRRCPLGSGWSSRSRTKDSRALISCIATATASAGGAGLARPPRLLATPASGGRLERAARDDVDRRRRSQREQRQRHRSPGRARALHDWEVPTLAPTRIRDICRSAARRRGINFALSWAFPARGRPPVAR